MSISVVRPLQAGHCRSEQQGNLLVAVMVMAIALIAAVITAMEASDRSQRHVNTDVEQP